MQTGDIITFGNYSWQVLCIQDSMALIITKHIIDHRPYNDKYVDTTWAECSLRKYLNNDFYESFDLVQREQIVEVTNANNANQWYGTAGGIETKDKIFLLSVEDLVCKYFGDSSSLLFNPRKTQRYWFERKDVNNSKRIATLVNDTKQVWWWWTCTPGRVGIKAVYVHGDGNIGIQGNNILKGNVADGKCTGGVRPAMWIKI